MKNILSVALIALNIVAISAKGCIDPSKIQVQIYDDENCANMNLDETKNNELSQTEIDTFNDCHELQLGNKFIYMQNICLKMSFNIQFFADPACSKKLNDPDFRDLYTYEWDKCYKRTATQYMIIPKPVWRTETNVKPGPVSTGASFMALSSAVSLMVLTIANIF